MRYKVNEKVMVRANVQVAGGKHLNKLFPAIVTVLDPENQEYKVVIPDLDWEQWVGVWFVEPVMIERGYEYQIRMS